MIKKAILSFPAGSAGDPDGRSPQYLKVLLGCRVAMAGDPGGARGAIAPPEKIVRGRTLAFAPPEIQVSVKFAPATQIEDPSIICMRL